MNSFNRITVLIGAAVMMVAVSLSATEFSASHARMSGIEITLGEESQRTLMNDPKNTVWFMGSYERGFIDVLSHTIQFGSDGTPFDYVEEGGQNILFPFQRLSAEIHFGPRHGIVLLYQPLDIRTEALLDRDIVVDELTFPADTPLELRYGFDFYRFSYLFDLSRNKDKEIAIGLSLQLRNASIWFKSADGTLFRVNQNVGPVPILKFRARLPFKKGVWFGSEIDGFYANGRYISGSDNDFEGAILDASLRMGFDLNASFATFLNVRYVGGGARGFDEGDTAPGDGYTDNWLHTLAVTLGMYVQ